jgi:uncharacterized glyoxalase superfamily protein PhnB
MRSSVAPASSLSSRLSVHQCRFRPGRRQWPDLDRTFARLQASGAEVVQEPTEQPYGVRDCAFRDPAGNLIRIQELR